MTISIPICTSYHTGYLLSGRLMVGGMEVNNSEDDPQSSSNNVLKMLNDVKGNRTTNNIVSRFYAQLRPFKGLINEGSYTYAFSDQFLYQQPVFHDLWNLYDNTFADCRNRSFEGYQPQQ